MNKRLNKKDFEVCKSFFRDYEEFRDIKKELEIYDFKRMNEEEFIYWINNNAVLRIENITEYERRLNNLFKYVIITKLYF